MRAEIGLLHKELGVTTIYVTHDQVEAMTLGERVAVMRRGELQQVATPTGALRHARQPVRRRVHRQPGDELLRGRRLETRRRTALGRVRRAAARASTSARLARRGLARSWTASADVGVRPEHLEDAALAPATPANRRLKGTSGCASCSAPRSSCISRWKRRRSVTDEMREIAEDVDEWRCSTSSTTAPPRAHRVRRALRRSARACGGRRDGSGRRSRRRASDSSTPKRGAALDARVRRRSDA